MQIYSRVAATDHKVKKIKLLWLWKQSYFDYGTTAFKKFSQ